jgi:hypothetical protein
MVTDVAKNFNEVLCQSIDETITEIVGTNVLKSLYNHLNKHYSVTREELPYRLDTMYTVLDQVFGVRGARTIGRQIAKRLCAKFKIPFLDTPDCTLEMYIEKAKKASS